MVKKQKKNKKIDDDEVCKEYDGSVDDDGLVSSAKLLNYNYL